MTRILVGDALARLRELPDVTRIHTVLQYGHA